MNQITLELNKIHCLDCFEGIKQISDKSVNLIITDPPYGMSFQSNRRKEKHAAIVNDDNVVWLPQLMAESFRVLDDCSHMYLFCSHHNMESFICEGKKYFELKSILVWEKNNIGMGDLDGDYAPQCEFILFFTKGRRLLNGGRNSNILRFARTMNELHPTEKPVDLIRFLIEKSSNPTELVLDPFMGSGTTAVACKQALRTYMGFEINSVYVDTANKRLKQGNILNWF
jgi:site-specific DNA-methyltransferase (adenine-specific)